MSRLRVHGFGVSLDGYGAGPGQTLEHPMGVGGMVLHQWVLGTRTWQRTFAEMSGTPVAEAAGATGVDDDFAARGTEHIGAWILGRHMFGPVRGPWTDDEWKGWWGKSPPYHVPVFVLTHHARAPIVMEGGTTFHFVTDGHLAALARAKEAAGSKDVRLGGGVATVRQYLSAGLIDEMHVAIAPALLGQGEHLWQGIDAASLGYVCKTHVATKHATHVVLSKEARR